LHRVLTRRLQLTSPAERNDGTAAIWSRGKHENVSVDLAPSSVGRHPWRTRMNNGEHALARDPTAGWARDGVVSTQVGHHAVQGA